MLGLLGIAAGATFDTRGGMHGGGTRFIGWVPGSEIP
jgi:hypothetical protein